LLISGLGPPVHPARIVMSALCFCCIAGFIAWDILG
jgi:hypothetical protein